MAVPEINFNPNLLYEDFNTEQDWFKNSIIAQGIRKFLWSFSNLFAPQELLSRLDNNWYNFYKQRIKNIPGRNLIIFGTGLGILPIIAMSENRKIYACDRFPFTSRLSQGIIKKYCLQNKIDDTSIKFITKDYLEINKDDIPETCNFLIFDDFDHTLLETGIVPIIEFFKRNDLLRADAVIMPSNVDIYSSAIEIIIDDQFFNLDELREYLWNIGPKPFDDKSQRYKALSEDIKIASLDFSKEFQSLKKVVTFHMTDPGNWNAIIYWHELFGKKNYLIQYMEPKSVVKGQAEKADLFIEKTKIRFKANHDTLIPKNKSLPSWHFKMVNDSVRNQGYAKSITKCIKENNIDSILDIGSGTGLLSLMAAKANPNAKIISCEIQKNLSTMSEKIIENNGLNKRIFVTNEDILQLVLGKKVDLVICEMFAAGLLGEGILHFLQYAKANLMKSDAKVIPMGAKVKGMLIEYRTPDFDNISMSLTNAYRWFPEYTSIDLSDINYKQLSDPFDVFSFDFYKPEIKREQMEINIPIIEDGIVSAVVFWFDLFLDIETSISTNPFYKEKCHWNQALQYVKEIEVKKNMKVPLIAVHDSKKIDFGINANKLNPEITAISTPRFDPAWLNEYYDIEKKYRDMIIRISQKPEEYKELADISTKIAAQAGSFNLRLKFANRLAESLFVK